MNTPVASLSPNAQKLLIALKAASMWEDKSIEVLFPKPVYVGTMDGNYTTEEKEKIQRAYWQWDANLYGANQIRPVLGTSVEFVPTANYYEITYEAYKELRDAGFASASNSGYNTYCYYYTGKK